MKREEQLKFCKICSRHTVSLKKGIICSLTGEQATFEKTCPDYNEDESLKKDLEYKKNKITKNPESTAIILLIASAVTFFITPIILKKLEVSFVKPIMINIPSVILLIIAIESFLTAKNITIRSSIRRFGIKSSVRIRRFGIIGAILGLPLSYYFQPDMVQAKVGGIGGYVKNFGDILSEKDLISNVVIGVIVFAAIGIAIGYFMDKNAKPETDK